MYNVTFFNESVSASYFQDRTAINAICNKILELEENLTFRYLLRCSGSYLKINLDVPPKAVSFNFRIGH